MAGEETVIRDGRPRYCSFCSRPLDEKTDEQVPASYDGKTIFGPWAYMCDEHFDSFGLGLGEGVGQRLIFPDESVWTDTGSGAGVESELRHQQEGRSAEARQARIDAVIEAAKQIRRTQGNVAAPHEGSWGGVVAGYCRFCEQPIKWYDGVWSHVRSGSLYCGSQDDCDQKD